MKRQRIRNLGDAVDGSAVLLCWQGSEKQADAKDLCFAPAIIGGCFCGNVRFEIDQDPLDG